MSRQNINDPLLAHLAQQQNTTNFNLPELKAEELHWVNFIRDKLKSLVEWISGKGQIDIPEIITKESLIFLSWLLLGIFVLYLTYYLIAKPRLRNRSATKAPSPKRSDSQNPSDGSRFEHRIRLLLDASNWSEAIRLRWQYLLHQINHPSSTTPREFSRQQPQGPLTEKLLNDLYNLMFNPSYNLTSYESYRSLDANLEEIAQNLRSAKQDKQNYET